MADAGRDVQLVALRARLYGRNPPASAERDYLAALAERAVPDGVAGVAPTPAIGRRRILSVAALAVVTAAAITAAVLAPVGSQAPAAQHGARSASAAAPTPDFDAALVPPDVPGTVLAVRTSADPTGPIAIDAGHRTIVVAAICTEPGTVSISFGDGGGGTVLVCPNDQPAFGMAQSSRPIGATAVRVTTTGSPSWALSIGTMPQPTASSTGCSTCREARSP